MEQHEPVNRSERMRWRAFNQLARKGNYAGYWQLVNLSLELPSIRWGAEIDARRIDPVEEPA